MWHLRKWMQLQVSSGFCCADVIPPNEPLGSCANSFNCNSRANVLKATLSGVQTRQRSKPPCTPLQHNVSHKKLEVLSSDWAAGKWRRKTAKQNLLSDAFFYFYFFPPPQRLHFISLVGPLFCLQGGTWGQSGFFMSAISRKLFEHVFHILPAST